MPAQVYGPVLLVCIYNKYGNIITHDYFYQLFSQYGEIVKILIFEKAKVWKTFVEFTDLTSAQAALINLNNHVVFQDGSRMNIFPSKLQHIKLQNTNLGGVNYEELKLEQEVQKFDFQEKRGQSHTYQQHSESFFNFNDSFSNGPNFEQDSCKDQQSTFSFQSLSNKKSFNTFDIDEQFLQLARESQEFRELQREGQTFRQNRRKSKTIIANPHMEQFVMENSPSPVIFIRSIPSNFTNKCLYNIFKNFGNVLRVIYMKDKASGLVEFEHQENAISAKDQMNYAKAEIKVFYSHYETLNLRKQSEGEDFEEYSKIQKEKKSPSPNPPSQILYLTMATPYEQKQIRSAFQQIGCPIFQMDWKQSCKNRWMCLANLGTIQKSLTAMGFMQNLLLQNGKQLKLSFTRSRISSPHNRNRELTWPNQ